MKDINQAEVYTRTDGKFDFRIRSTENGNILCGSDQGYEHRSDAIDMARRVLFGQATPVITFDQEETP